ncbi:MULTISPECIES: hypothetical protein [unclassified Gilliamella]|uniref:hypothetical protein n=1 Tax=unclassified Gilliamella TaxID=2685620 RepID=UPI001C69B904|nr:MULTISPECIES: hypothetical protein [unclassified Gilliamella]MCX8660395.1 hypothetical protein [Gilliamella sp. B2772]MCX8684177.1 hypothetical protein [Gilliamella sp. B2889]QYN41401.1 hypothetical protein GYM76_00975 [Gilliamella sp. ESL0443]
MKFLSRIALILFCMVLFYYPFKITKYYLMDMSYDEISNVGWHFDTCKTKDDALVSSNDCPCGGLIEPDDGFYINNEGYMFLDNELYGKVTLIEKPSYFQTELYTGGTLKIEHIDTGLICYFDSVMD